MRHADSDIKAIDLFAAVKLEKEFSGFLEINREKTSTYFIQAFSTDEVLFTAPKRAPLEVPPGYQFYWVNASAPRWTDNKDNGSNRDLTGWDFRPQEQEFSSLRRAQLFGLALVGGNNQLAPY